jgi:hypothetical protein
MTEKITALVATTMEYVNKKYELEQKNSTKDKPEPKKS